MSTRSLGAASGHSGRLVGLFGYTGGHGASISPSVDPLVHLEERIERLRVVVISAHGVAACLDTPGREAIVSSSGWSRRVPPSGRASTPARPA